MSEENVVVEIEAEATIHKIFAQVIQDIYEDTGIRVEYVRVDWSMGRLNYVTLETQFSPHKAGPVP